jgi:SAM-dependent methyltransferase
MGMALEVVTNHFPKFEPLTEVERAVKDALREYLQSIRQWNLEKNIEELTSLDGGGYQDRFNYFLPRIEPAALDRLLVSGCAVGGEMIVARNNGFKEVYGTEVGSEYARIAALRLKKEQGYYVSLYDGNSLPYQDNFFTSICSAHIIEHTPNPFTYFREHFRVLAPGGYFFLEFPDRYHPIELHTGLTSYEYLPRPVRAMVLLFLSSRFSPASPEHRRLYNAVRTTLQPISVSRLKWFLWRMGVGSSAILHHYEPAPGFCRVLLRKAV